MEPAAHNTTSRGSDSSLTAPITADWRRQRLWCRPSYAACTIASHSACQRRWRRRCGSSALPSPRGQPPARSSPSRASATRLRRRQLVGVERRDVEVDEPYVVGREHRVRRGGEVAVAGADADDQVGLRGQGVRGGGAGRADRTDGLRVVVRQRALAGLGLGHRDAGRLGEVHAARRWPGCRSRRRPRRSAGAAPRGSPRRRAPARLARPPGGRRATPAWRTARPASPRPRPARPAAGRSSRRRSRPGSVSTRIALSSAGASCSGRCTRSK